MKTKVFMLKFMLFLSIALAMGGALYTLFWQIRVILATWGMDHEVVRGIYLGVLAYKILPVLAPAVIGGLLLLNLQQKMQSKYQLYV